MSVTVVLGTIQTLAWASSFYLPAILADPISDELGFPSAWFFAAFSCSLVVAAMVGPRVGRIVFSSGLSIAALVGLYTLPISKAKS